MIVSLLTHICITQPQWVELIFHQQIYWSERIDDKRQNNTLSDMNLGALHENYSDLAVNAILQIKIV